MLSLLLCAILSEWLQPGIITQAHESLIAKTDRTYKESPNTFFGQALIILFRIGTVAMALCLCIYKDADLSFAVYGMVCGLVVALLLVKMLFNVIVDYTFELSRRFGSAFGLYADIATLAILALYPLVLVMLRVDNPGLTQWGTGIVALIFIGMWIYRSARLYIVSLKAVLYFVLYIATMEVLPFVALYVLSAKMISIL